MIAWLTGSLAAAMLFCWAMFLASPATNFIWVVFGGFFFAAFAGSTWIKGPEPPERPVFRATVRGWIVEEEE